MSSKDKHAKSQEKYQAILSNMLREEDNKYCADCEAKGPRWTSWNLGVFICIRCAGIHRNLGVHISKVKSVNLDQWTPEQIASMMAMGNSRAKAIYECNLADNYRRSQSDSAMEQFIRAKYEQKKWIDRNWSPSPITIPPQLIEDEKDKRKHPEMKLKSTLIQNNSTNNNTVSNKKTTIDDNSKPAETKTKPLKLDKPAEEPVLLDFDLSDGSKQTTSEDLFDNENFKKFNQSNETGTGTGAQPKQQINTDLGDLNLIGEDLSSGGAKNGGERIDKNSILALYNNPNPSFGFNNSAFQQKPAPAHTQFKNPAAGNPMGSHFNDLSQLSANHSNNLVNFNNGQQLFSAPNHAANSNILLNMSQMTISPSQPYQNLNQFNVPNSNSFSFGSHPKQTSSGIDLLQNELNFGSFASSAPTAPPTVNKNPSSTLPNLIGNTLVSDLWN